MTLALEANDIVIYKKNSNSRPQIDHEQRMGGLSRAGVIDLKYALESLAIEFNSLLSTNRMDTLKKHVQIYQDYYKIRQEVSYEDPQTGFKIWASKNGHFYMQTSRGLVAHVTTNSIKIRDVDGELKTMGVSSRSIEALKFLTGAVGKEVLKWIDKP